MRGDELRELKRLAAKMVAAAEKADEAGRCPVERRFKYGKQMASCSHHFHFETGRVHHYPNGKYIE